MIPEQLTDRAEEIEGGLLGSPRSSPKRSNTHHVRFWIGLVLILAVVMVVWWNRDRLTLESLVGYESQLRNWQTHAPLLVFAAGFGCYVAITGLSLPGAAALTLACGWVFGVVEGTLLASFASTTGASIAFLLSRYFFRESLQDRLGKRWQRFQESLDRDGAFYLFTLRLLPAVPFFAINAGMGLTRIRLWTFWWVSQIGMLPGTALYIYAGSRIPTLHELSREGIYAIISVPQLLQLTIAFALLGLFPFAARKAVRFLRRSRAN